MSPSPPISELLDELRTLLRSPGADGEVSCPAALPFGSGRIALRLIRHTEQPEVRLLDLVTELDNGDTSERVLAMGTADELLGRLDDPGLPQEIRRLAREGSISLAAMDDHYRRHEDRW